GHILRVTSFLRLEWLMHSPVRAELGIKTEFGDDVLAYCTERMDPETTRGALAAALHQAKRNKAFENSRFIGLALDGTGAGRTYKEPCPLCDPVKDSKGEVHGSLHHFVMISVVGTGLTLPLDVEPYGPGDSEYAAAQRLLRRAVDHLGSRFADYVVGDGEYATAPFLHTTDALGLPVVARLKENLPGLAAAVRELESVLQRWQESLWHGAHLPSRAQQHPHRLAVDRASHGDRTPLPVALLAPWRPWRSHRHGLIHLSLAYLGLPQSARFRLNPVPCGRLAALRCSLKTRRFPWRNGPAGARRRSTA